MATRPINRLLGQVRRSLDAHHSEDGDLLERYRSGDLEPFETILRKHGSFVLAACRKVLSDPADIDDAFQATFVVLMHDAHRIKTPQSLSSWLYGVAHRIALQARNAKRRRTRLEAKAKKQPIEETNELSWREACERLHEELNRLPDKYRLPLMLCYLEGKSRDEAASQLGVSVNVLRGQLERGRDRLRKRLEKAGITLSAGLLVASVSDSGNVSAAPSTQLLQATLQGLQSPTPRVAQLAHGVTLPMIPATMKILASLAVCIGLVAALPPLESRSSTPMADVAQVTEQPKTTPAKAESPPDATPMRAITGVVVDPNGKPVAKAEIIHFPIGGHPTIAARTDTEGKFSVSVPLKGPGSWLFPRVAGYGAGDYLMPATNTPNHLTFRLVKDVPITGRLVDTEGKPIVNASVVVRHVSGFEEKNLDRFLKAWQKRESANPGPSPNGGVHWTPLQGQTPLYRKLSDGTELFAASTDRDGRFTINNVGQEREVNLHIEANGFVDTELAVITREKFDPAPYNRKTLELMKREDSYGYNPLLLAPKLEQVIEREKLIRGTVTDHSTGKPLVGIRVRLRPTYQQRIIERSTVTDANGKFEIHGAPKLAKYHLFFSRDTEKALLGRELHLSDTTGFEPIIADTELYHGIVLTGRIRDRAANSPLFGFVCVGVLADNEFANQTGFESPDCYDDADTNAEGVYRTVVPPGNVLLMAGARGHMTKTDRIFEDLRPDPDYPQYFEPKMHGFRGPKGVTTIMQGQFCKVLKLKADQPEVKFDVFLNRASMFRVKFQDPQGKPLENVLLAGGYSKDWARPEPSEKDTSYVFELDKAKPRLLVYREPKRNLCGHTVLKGNEKQPVVVQLKPAGEVTGQLLDSDGKPLAKIRVELRFNDRTADEIDRMAREMRQSEGTAIETDAEGRFVIKGITPDLPFQVTAKQGAKFLKQRKENEDFKAESGKLTDLGAIELK